MDVDVYRRPPSVMSVLLHVPHMGLSRPCVGWIQGLRHFSGPVTTKYTNKYLLKHVELHALNK